MKNRAIPFPSKAGLIAFSKLQGTGNDFILIDALSQDLLQVDWVRLAPFWCDRRGGVGADGLLLLYPSSMADYRMRIINADGSEAEMCGNGIRCFAHYLFTRHCPSQSTLTIETGAGMRRVSRLNPEATQIRVEMGTPRLTRQEVPMAGEPADEPVLDIPFPVEGYPSLTLSAVNTGTPHAVLFVDKPLETFPLEAIGRAIETHPLFPQRTNVQVAYRLDAHRIQVRSWERGVGATLACGTGACAVVVVGHLTGRVARRAQVLMPGGELEVEWDEQGVLWLTGPAVEVFKGTLSLEAFPTETPTAPTGSPVVAPPH